MDLGGLRRAPAERPIGWRMTSTLRGGISCGDVAITSGVGDWGDDSAVRCTAVVDTAARVREVVTPADWHALCASHPRVRSKPEPSLPPRSVWHCAPLDLEQEGPDRAGILVPDWSALAADLDSVHLTFAGLLTVPFVEHESDTGRTMMWSWDTEGTTWLQGDFLRAGEPLPPAPEGLDSDKLVRYLSEDYLGIPRSGLRMRAQRRRWWWPFGRGSAGCGVRAHVDAALPDAFERVRDVHGHAADAGYLYLHRLAVLQRAEPLMPAHPDVCTARRSISTG